MDPEHNANSGLAKRAAWVFESHVFEVVGRPHLDLFHQNKLIPPGINMLIRFILANDTFVIKTTDAQYLCNSSAIYNKVSISLYDSRAINNKEPLNLQYMIVVR